MHWDAVFGTCARSCVRALQVVIFTGSVDFVGEQSTMEFLTVSILAALTISVLWEKYVRLKMTIQSVCELLYNRLRGSSDEEGGGGDGSGGGSGGSGAGEYSKLADSTEVDETKP